MPLNYTAYTLDEVTIEEVSAYVQDYLGKQGVERRNIQRLRLTVEEMLLNVMHGCGKGIQVSIGIGKQFGRHVFNLRYNGEPFDPTQSDENTQGNEIISCCFEIPGRVGNLICSSELFVCPAACG